LEHEVFGCLFLDNQHAVIAAEDLFRGTIDGASVYPREVVKRALALNAAAVILYHNHPSGVSEPSQSDQRLTQRLKAALGTVDIRVLDHFVVGRAEALSFAERGLL
jgi:DNA repair protein RadC